MILLDICISVPSVCRLHSFSMEVANPTARGERRASAVEVCSCPYGYGGTSCEVNTHHSSICVNGLSNGHIRLVGYIL